METDIIEEQKIKSIDFKTELEQYKRSFQLVVNAINKAAKSGAFNIDEAYACKIALLNLETALKKYEDQ